MERPDLLVSTHSQTNVILSIWKRDRALSSPIHSVVTDFATHAIWARPEIDRYYVASASVEDALCGYGVKRSKVEVTGIPISSRLAEAPRLTRGRAREELGLETGLPTIVMMGGSLGYGPFVQVVEELERQRRNVRFLAICGRNVEERSDLEKLKTSLRFVRLKTYGFVQGIEVFYDAADVVLTKPGGVAVSEILTRNRPMILIRPARGIQIHMARAIGDLGVAEIADSPEDGASRAWGLATDPDRARAMVGRMKEYARPAAARVVVAGLLSAAGRRAP
jgi:processive 1,2-diacylglycerol beta-glucosyltransferase